MIVKTKEICEKKTNLTASDIEEILKIAATMDKFAELSQSYMFIDCLSKNHEHAIVVAEAYPQDDIPLYTKSVLGKDVFEIFEPGVFYSFRKGEKSIIKNAINQEGRNVHQTVIPIKNKENKIIAVLIEEKEVEFTKNIHLEESNLSIPTQVLDIILSYDNSSIPIVSDLLMEMFILTNHEHALIYANPVGVKFLVEMSGTNKIYQENITELLPFLKEIYDEKDEDVYVFERTIERKSLVIKKIKLKHTKNNMNTLLIIQDLTELKMKEKELSMKSIMIEEIHHRVKNNLQTIASLLRLQMHQSNLHDNQEHFEVALNRIFSISAVYELILSNDDSSSELVNIVELTRKVCSKLVINSVYKNIDLIIQTNDHIIFTSQKKAVSISLIINELVQNILKHAFQPEEEGDIRIEFHVNEDVIEIHVIDNGIGMKDVQPSLGLNIVRNLVESDLEGEFAFLSTALGTHALISFKKSPEVRVSGEEDIISGR